MRDSYTSVKILLVLFLAVILASCSAKQPLPTEEERLEARKQVPCIVVLPVDTAVNSDASMTYKRAAVLEEGAAFMDTIFVEEFIDNNSVRVLSARQLTSLIPEDSGAQSALIKRVGSELKCAAVLVTTLSDYRQRVGGSYGADSPASAMFAMKLVSARSGEVLWTGVFKETQQSLMSNILAQNRGFTWITVEELIRQGIEEKIAECPYL